MDVGDSAPPHEDGVEPAARRLVGIDVGSETIKLVELAGHDGRLRCVRRQLIEHHKEPGARLRDALASWDWPGVDGAAVSGRLSRQVALPRIPAKQAQLRGYRWRFGERPATIVSIGSHGFSVLELRVNGVEVRRENSRCSQGTGNFLRQLIERFALSIEDASELCADVVDPAPLSGRCPVILKTDMTHLANKGENRAQILAGLFDAVCENVLCLVKPGLSPEEVFLIGGVSRSRRIRNTLRRALADLNMTLVALESEDALFLEALGCAALAAESPAPPPALADLLQPVAQARLDRIAPLSASLPRVHRMASPPPEAWGDAAVDLVLGFDIGSTGSKLVAFDAATQTSRWEGYCRTSGDPVGAAQGLLRELVALLEGERLAADIRAAGVTGSGREIVGSLLATCYGKDAVFILNEIAAHAEGALRYDSRVDTIFEIGGQDAKYIRLAGGRVVDCAMNEACSAGTGSFIEEQGRKFSGIADVAQLGTVALRAGSGVSLGQHCSVFMAEVIDDAVAAGTGQEEIIAGLYDSIVQNYLNRVKGNRSVGQVIFCQGMPFSADALAAAVARQTGSEVIVPPNPGTVGALGIALLAGRALPWRENGRLEPRRFLEARIERKDTFCCKSNVACGGPGNKCRIDSLRTVVAGQRQRFTWGGGCSLHDKGTRKRKLPDLAPDPFREREELVAELTSRVVTAARAVDPTGAAAALGARRDGRRKTVALTDEFLLKSLFPFFATFLHELGLDLVAPEGGDQAALKRGIQGANVPFCAPLQLFHGLVGRMAETASDFLFVPMLRATPRVDSEPNATVCPTVQASPDILRWDLRAQAAGRVVSPVIDIGVGNLESPEFLASCRRTAAAFGGHGPGWRAAHCAGVRAQLEFDRRCQAIGRRALEFCAARDIPAVVVLGRPYTIYNKVLNSNVPALLREQGVLGIPVDCYPLGPATPVFADVYWGYSQRILRAAHEVRRAPGVYSVYCSNYACGPDSFGLHFYSYMMDGKPFAVIETDGHSGDAGTKTRIEAFLHCVEQDRAPSRAAGAAVSGAIPPERLTSRPRSLANVQVPAMGLADLPRDERLLVPSMGTGSAVIAACLSGLGYCVETLPEPTAESLETGRRHTSGKECVPMCMTLGTLLDRLAREPRTDTKFVLGMPRTCGPCRFGVYNLLNRIVLEQLGWRDRVRILSPIDEGYFDDAPPGFTMLLFAGIMGSGLLLNALLEARPGETRPGAAKAIHERYHAELLRLCEEQARRGLRTGSSLWQVAGGELFGIADLLRRAAIELAAVRDRCDRPVILVVGEIYVRSVPFANDFVVEKLEERGCRTQLAPFSEWIDYADYLGRSNGSPRDLSARLSTVLQARIRDRLYAIVAEVLGWPAHLGVEQSLAAAAPYLRQELEGEAILTLGTALCAWRARRIDGAVAVGPLECMPNKIAEAQFFHIAEQEGLPTLTLPMNGDSIPPESLDNFTFEVHARAGGRKPRRSGR